MILAYLDRDAKRIVASMAEQCTVSGRAAYMWRGEIEPCSGVYAPGRPDIVKAYAAAGVPEFVPSGEKRSEKVDLPKHTQIVVLSCGPSGLENLNKYKGLPILGVNTMPYVVKCDYALALDGINRLPELFPTIGPIKGDPIRIIAKDYIAADAIGKWAPLEDYAKRQTWSSITAVMVAASIAETVYCLGFDWKPGTGSDGISSGRDSKRNWDHERRMFEDFAKTTACKVVRVAYDSEAPSIEPIKRTRGKPRKG